MSDRQEPMENGIFARTIERVLAELPEELRAALGTVQIVVQERPSTEQLASVGLDPDEDLFGLFEGLSLKEAPLGSDRTFPDRVILFQEPLARHFPRRAELEREIRTTLIHELGHYFGFDEEELHERGWE